jgi:hypothetical protein
MKKVFPILIFSVCAAAVFASPNAQVITDGSVPLPKESQLPARTYVTPFTTVPLEPRSGPVILVKPAPIPLTSPNTAIFTTPPPIPLIAPDEPTVLPSSTVPIQQYASSTLYESPTQTNYRIVNMQLNDFGVAMARKAGLNYIYNPAVRGTVNGYFRNTDPIYMLHMAAKANGYKFVIRDGILGGFEPQDSNTLIRKK